jgi:hypothetical protein
VTITWSMAMAMSEPRGNNLVNNGDIH